MKVTWGRCERGNWCPLNTVNLDHSVFQDLRGVYIIWYNGSSGRTVRLGQGIIKDRLAAHREDRNVQAYAKNTLYVTWAAVDATSRDGVEAYLAEQLNPLVGERFPDRTPIAVNLPM